MINLNIIHKQSTGSTNADIKNLLNENISEGTIVWAETQTAGRGRHDRTWHSPTGLNLYFSILLQPQNAIPARLPQLAMIAAIALHQTILDIAPEITAGLKWPNDIWLNDRKVSGILCEAENSPRLSIILGIGLNVNSTLDDFPPALQSIATSLKIASGKSFDRKKIIEIFCRHLFEDYQLWQNGSENLFEYWNRYDILKQRMCRIIDRGKDISGIADGITDTGFLRLLTSDGVKIISAGDVHIAEIN